MNVAQNPTDEQHVDEEPLLVKRKKRVWRVSASIAIRVGIACPRAHKKMETRAGYEAHTGHHGPLPREVTKDKMDPCGTTLEEERRTAEKAQVVGLCCGRDFGEALGRLGGRWAGGQPHHLQHELYVCIACEHCGCERR